MDRQDGASVQAPRRNIELKATDPDPIASLDVCQRLGADDRGTIEQRDTYFDVARDGLKLREEQPGRPHLIQFERVSEPQQRESRYRIIEVSDGATLSAALDATIGIRGVAAKRRRLFLVSHGSGRPKAVPTIADVLCPQAVCPSRRLSQCSAIS